MANQNYAKANAAFLRGEINWLADNIKVCILSPSYVGGAIAIASDQYYSAIADYVLAGTQTVKSLTNKTVSVGSSYGITNADPVTFTAVSQGQIVGYYCLLKDPDGENIDGPPGSGNQGSAPLIHLIDGDYGVGMGSNGGDIALVWNALGIFKL